MIFDRIDHACRYRSLSESFRKAFDFLASLDLSALTDGRFPIDGEAIYATVGPSSLREPEDALFEAHRKYADIQLVLSGGENMQVTEVSALTPDAPFQEESDIGFYQNGCRCQTLSFAPGDFAVFFPEDAHKPCCRSDAASCRKLIVKVALD